MHFSEINHDMQVRPVEADLRENETFRNRPILLGYLAEVDGTDVLVPASEAYDASSFIAFTHEQAAQALLLLAGQIGKAEALLLIEEML